MAGKGLGGKCPSMEEGLGVVAAQAASHPPPPDLDSTIAAMTARLQSLQSQFAGLSGTVGSPQPGCGPFVANAAGAFMPGFGLAPNALQFSPTGSWPSPPSTPATVGSPPVPSVVSPPSTPHAPTFRTINSGLSEAEQKAPQLSHAPTGTTLDYGKSAISLDTPTPPHSGGHVPYPDRMPDSYLDSYVDTKVDTPKAAESEPEKTNAVEQSTVAKGNKELTGQTMPAQDTQADSPSSNGNNEQVSSPVAPVTTAPAAPCQQQPQQADPSQAVAPVSAPAAPCQQQPEQAVTSVTNAPAAPCQEQPTQATQPDKGWVTQQHPSSASNPPPPKKNKYQDGTYWKLRNYVKPNNRGEVKASENVLKMFKTEKGREELRRLLLQQGTLEQVEVQLEKQHVEEESNTLRGGWHSEATLAMEGWTAEMISHSKKWAEARGLCFKSEIHGEDEWRVPVRREFEHKNLDRQSNTSRVEFVTQDTTGELMENPTDRDALMKGGPNGPGTMAQVSNMQSAANSKLNTLPSLQANTCPYSLLPNFIEGVAKKISKAEETEDHLRKMDMERATQLADEIAEKVKEMDAKYKELTASQQNLMADDAPQSSMKSDLTKLYVACTKVDVLVNNLLSRARTVKPPKAPKAKAVPKSSSSKPPLSARRKKLVAMAETAQVSKGKKRKAKAGKGSDATAAASSKKKRKGK